jgi:hypothetical protein
MRRQALSFLCLGVTLAAAGQARAQDTPRVGITMGYPAAVGVIWNVDDRFALRPEVTFAGSSGDSSGSDVLGPSPGLTTDLSQVGVGISALIYLGRQDVLRMYVSPRFAYTHTSSSTNGVSTILPLSSETTGSAYSTSGSFGAQYALARRFGVFGEIGAGYSSSKATATSTLNTLTSGGFLGVPFTTTTSTQIVRSESRIRSWNVRTGVGVIFYF